MSKGIIDKRIYKTKGITHDAIFDAFVKTGSTRAVSKLLGVSRSSAFRKRVQKVIAKRVALPAFEPVEMPPVVRPVDELIASAITHRERLQANMRTKHNAVLPLHNNGKPFGVALIPDQHMDNPGSNLKLIFSHAKLIAKTDGLYACELGDSIDNFIISKLEAARRSHIISVPEAWSLSESYHKIFAHKLLAAISGNHTEWTNKLGGADYLAAVLHKAGVKALYDADELYFSIRADNKQTWKYGVRHFFQGGSLWNAAHSVSRYAMSHAYRSEDVVVAGHRHVAGYQIVESHGNTVHCVQTGSYKDRELDDYCRAKGFMAQHPFLVPVMIHFPDTRKSVFFPEIESAVPYLKYLRGKK